MDSNELKLNISKNIANYRKKLGLTQEELAKKLYVSNKTISKWERGAGYPEITQIVNIAKILNISIDNLLNGNKTGIAIAGNLLTDNVKIIDSYPEKGMLSNISELSRAVGGCVPNTGIDLSIIDNSLNVSAIGKIGSDESGNYVIMELQNKGIDTSMVSVSKTKSTGFSDVMSISETGERTFFHHRGANADFSPSDVDIDSLNCKMLHIGYILLLDEFDKEDSEYGTVMARFLKNVQDAGILTSIDVVSSNTGLFAEKVTPALKYTDNAIMNEIECCKITNLQPRNKDNTICIENIKKSMEFMLSQGVKSRVIIHCPEAGFMLNKDGKFTIVPSLKLPKGYIKGTVGAGDAFCAGCLYGIYNEFSDEEILEFASGAAACNLSAEDSVSGMKNKNYILQLIKENEKLKI